MRSAPLLLDLAQDLIHDRLAEAARDRLLAELRRQAPPAPQPRPHWFAVLALFLPR
jgi:hypothetical protein